jgi:NAD+ kinase
MKYGVVCKMGLEEGIDHVQAIVNLLKEAGEDVILEEWIAGALKMGEGVPLEKMDPDIVITVGGDGTLLRTLEHTKAPVFGINAGLLGFLTEIPLEESILGVKRVLAGDYLVEMRSKLRTEHNGVRLPDAMNEAVIHTSQIAKMQLFEVLVDDMFMDRIRGDGLIVATPTGSTSYSMSVGGPIVDPRVRATIIVPIAAFKLSARPHIVPMDSKIKVNVLNPKPTMMVLDGQYQREIKVNDSLTFGVSETPARFIRFKQRFYERIAKQLVI